MPASDILSDEEILAHALRAFGDDWDSGKGTEYIPIYCDDVLGTAPADSVAPRPSLEEVMQEIGECETWISQLTYRLQTARALCQEMIDGGIK
jgi:hypothetical protein